MKLEVDDNGILFLELGNGTTVISTLVNDTIVGVGFSHTSAGEVGAETERFVGNLDYESEVFLKIVTGNPKSLETLITRLIDAREELLRSTELTDTGEGDGK